MKSKNPFVNPSGKHKVLVIDNFDSFTFNLVHLIARQKSVREIVTIRNNAVSVEAALDMADVIVLSPGPSTPSNAGICLDLIAACAVRAKPLFGVCLGHQAIGEKLGGQVIRYLPCHGKVSTISHADSPLFRGIDQPFQATRYHSLIVETHSVPPSLKITAWLDDLTPMAFEHVSLPICSVQFHPESIATTCGDRLMTNFFDQVAFPNL